MIENAGKENAKRVWVLTRLIDSSFCSQQEAVNKSLSKLNQYEKLMNRQLKGVFTEAELCALIDISKATMINQDFALGKNEVIVASLEDSETYNGTLTKWAVNIEEIKPKILSLNSLILAYLQNELNAFWYNNWKTEKILLKFYKKFT